MSNHEAMVNPTPGRAGQVQTISDHAVEGGQTPLHIGPLEQAVRELSSADAAPFTPEAFQLLISLINSSIGDVIDTAIRMARRHRSEVVSSKHVYEASDYLIATRPRRLFRHMGTIGGILLGGSLSNILAMAQAGSNFPILGTLVSIAVGLVGTFFVAMHIAKD